MLIPMLTMVDWAAQAKICAILIGMAHRGRLNVLAHVLHKPYDQILAEFTDPKGRATTWDELGWTGDVKYHLGGYRSPDEDEKTDLVIRIPANPSHLEQIDPVIQGMARAANTKVDAAGPPRYFDNASLPILIHGDASFPAQGVVAETLNLRAARLFDQWQPASSPTTSWDLLPSITGAAPDDSRDSRYRSCMSTPMTHGLASKRLAQPLPTDRSSARISRST
jgi:2-oxoglutarate dehydrogenase complex dehydrogenase (E1) component-like enzyme